MPLYANPAGYHGAHLGAATPTQLPKPARPPYSLPTYAGVGYWGIPFKVRYAIAFADHEGNQGPLSEWTPWFTSGQYSNTVLSRFPVTADNYGSKFATCQNPGVPKRVHVWRQFQTQPAQLIYKLQYPYLSRLVDMRPDTN